MRCCSDLVVAASCRATVGVALSAPADTAVASPAGTTPRVRPAVSARPVIVVRSFIQFSSVRPEMGSQRTDTPGTGDPATLALFTRPGHTPHTPQGHSGDGQRDCRRPAGPRDRPLEG